MGNLKLRQAIDTIVGDIIANPDRAEELKRVLQHRIERADPTASRRRLPHVAGSSAAHDLDFDGVWDNVPV